LVRDGVILVDGFHTVGRARQALGDARYADAVLNAIDRLNDRRDRRAAATAGAAGLTQQLGDEPA
jgi:hypothetical protein